MLASGVIRESEVESRFDALHSSTLSPLVGRELQIELLLDRWRKACDGNGQVVMLSSEPGVGKSRLTRALAEQLSGQDFARLLYYCSPYHQNSALYPVVQQFQRAAGFAIEDAPETKLEKLEILMNRFGHGRTALPPLAHFLSIPTAQRYPEQGADPGKGKEAVIAKVIELLVDLSRRQPVLIIAEDLHWIDPTSLELLHLLVQRVQKLRVLIIVTFRPDFKLHWTGDHVSAVTLNRLDHDQSTDLVRWLTHGKPIPDEMADQIVTRADGVPLFIEELIKTVIESGLLLDKGDRYEMGQINAAMAIPATLRDSLLARLDRLTPVKEVAQIGAAIGREFSYELLSIVMPMPERDLEIALRQLTEAGLLFARGKPPRCDYAFKHALIQDTAYDSLLRSRRHVLHAQIARALEDKFPELSAAQPELLAHHYTLANDTERALEYWLKAGRRSTERSTGAEAISHLGKALEVLQSLPDSPDRARKELEIRIALVTPTISIKGYGSDETAQAIADARAIAEKVGAANQLSPIMYGEWAFNIVGGKVQASRKLADQYLRITETREDTAPLIVGHRMLGTSLASIGEFSLARDQLQRALALYDPGLHAPSAFVYGQDSCVSTLTFLALTLLILGLPEQALATGRRALDYAEEIKHPNTQGVALCLAGALLHEICGNAAEVGEYTAKTIQLAQHRSLGLWLMAARVFEWWILGRQGHWREAIAGLSNTLDAQKASGTYLFRSHFLGLLAELHAGAGNPVEGLAAIEEALRVVDQTGERMWEADLHRLKGELMLAADGSPTEAERCFMQAIAIARLQGARLWELRASLSLAHVWIGQKKTAAAHDLLLPSYQSFEANSYIRDVARAEALLKQLG